MSDIFDSVDDEIRQERAARFLQRAWPWALAAFLIVVAGVAGWELWRRQQAVADQRFTAALMEAQKQAAEGQAAAADKALGALIETGPVGHRALALMQRAGTALALEDSKRALAHLDAAAEVAREPLIRNAARLKAAYLAADLEGLKGVEARVKVLSEEGSVFQYPARELLGFTALQAGDPEKARAAFEFLTASIEAPDDVKQRARLGLAALPPKPETPPADAPAAAPAGDAQK